MPALNFEKILFQRKGGRCQDGISERIEGGQDIQVNSGRHARALCPGRCVECGLETDSDQAAGRRAAGVFLRGLRQNAEWPITLSAGEKVTGNFSDLACAGSGGLGKHPGGKHMSPREGQCPLACVCHWKGRLAFRSAQERLSASAGGVRPSSWTCMCGSCG